MYDVPRGPSSFVWGRPGLLIVAGGVGVLEFIKVGVYILHGKILKSRTCKRRILVLLILIAFCALEAGIRRWC